VIRGGGERLFLRGEERRGLLATASLGFLLWKKSVKGHLKGSRHPFCGGVGEKIVPASGPFLRYARKKVGFRKK